MVVYVVALAELIFYLGAVPLCGAFWLSTEGGLRFGVGLGAFERRFALRRAHRNGIKRDASATLFGTGRKGRRSENGPGAEASRAWALLRRLRGAGVRLEGRLCLGDAASTALACGALEALAAALGAALGRVELNVAPDFQDSAVRAELWGMIRVRSGQIIVAAAQSGIDKLNGRIAQWISTRLKAS